MLDVLRKHASSWAIKVIVGAIILTFAFFFGYSAVRKGQRGGIGKGDSIIARVNGRAVPNSKFKYFFDSNYEGLRKNFKGAEVPEFIVNMAKSTAIQQVITRELMMQEVDSLGIVIPDSELADSIKQVQMAIQGGQFDPYFYKQRYLPHFKNRYGLDYEEFMREDLRVEAFNDLFTNVDSRPIFDEAAPASEKWTFEIVEIDPKKMVESKVIKAEDEAKAIAETIASSPSKEWNRKFKELKVEGKKVGPITITERGKLADGKLSLDAMEKIFSLTAEKPVVPKPIESEGKFYIVQLTGRSKGEAKENTPAEDISFFRAWMSKLLAKAKVENFLPDEPPSGK